MLTQAGFLNELRKLLQKDERWNQLTAIRGPRKEVRLLHKREVYVGGDFGPRLRQLAYDHGWLIDTSNLEYTEFRPGYELPF